MDNGFYATLVEGNVAQTGITVIEDNRIRGGDAEFLYSGTIELTGDDVVANLRFRSYTASDKYYHIRALIGTLFPSFMLHSCTKPVTVV